MIELTPMNKYYITTTTENIPGLEKLDTNNSGITNLETKEEGLGTIKASIATDSLNHTQDQLKELSTTLGHTIYYLPGECTLIFDEKGRLVEATGNGAEQVWQYIDGWPMPYEAFTNGFPFPIKMEEAWKSDIEVEEVDIEELKWNLDIKWWTTDDVTPYNLKPIDVLNDIDSYPNHKKRTESSELKYPLLLIETKQNRWLIYDGAHRYLKAILQGDKKVKAQKFSIKEIEKYIHQNDLERFKEWQAS